MQNALAVYTAKSSIKGGKLLELAAAEGIQIRFMGLGGYPTMQDEILQNTLVKSNGKLVVGAFESDHEALVEFDGILSRYDKATIPERRTERESLAKVLKGGRLPWIELYVSRFDYANMVKRHPKDKPKIDGSVNTKELALVKKAKLRYIFYNNSRRKNGGELMKRLSKAVAMASDGVIADYQRPSR